MLRTTSQNKHLYGLIAKLGMNREQLPQLVHEFTNGRTYSSAEMDVNECKLLISHLDNKLHAQRMSGRSPGHRDIESVVEKRTKMVRKILACCHELGWYTDAVYTSDGKRKLNYDAINNFLLAKGAYKSKLNDIPLANLPAVVYQFEQLVKHRFKKVEDA